MLYCTWVSIGVYAEKNTICDYNPTLTSMNLLGYVASKSILCCATLPSQNPLHDDSLSITWLPNPILFLRWIH